MTIKFNLNGVIKLGLAIAIARTVLSLFTMHSKIQCLHEGALYITEILAYTETLDQMPRSCDR